MAPTEDWPDALPTSPETLAYMTAKELAKGAERWKHRYTPEEIAFLSDPNPELLTPAEIAANRAKVNL